MELLGLGVVADDEGQAQDEERDEELQDPDQEVRRLVVVVRGLLRGDVRSPGRHRGRVDLPYVELLHLIPRRVAVPHVLKVVRRVLPCNGATERERQRGADGA